MMTRDQAIAANEYHQDGCTRVVGPRGGVQEHIMRYRRNGATKTWRTRPSSFRVPVKYGMYGHSYVTEHELGHMHVASDCPLS